MMLQYDIKKRMADMFLSLGVYSQADDNTSQYDMFQYGLCCLVGFGSSPDSIRAKLSLSMAASNTSPTSPVNALVDRFLATVGDNSEVFKEGQSWQCLIGNKTNEA
jgi:hypothetical protein